MRHFVHIFIVALTLIGMAVPCLCWAQKVPSCHGAAEMEACCCSKDATVDRDMPARDRAVLPIEWQNPTLDLTGATLPVARHSHPISLPLLDRDLGAALRSPPRLYLLHASFLS